MKMTNGSIQYEAPRPGFLSTEARDFVIELTATALAGIIVILVFIGVTVRLGLL